MPIVFFSTRTQKEENGIYKFYTFLFIVNQLCMKKEDEELLASSSSERSPLIHLDERGNMASNVHVEGIASA